MFPLSQLSIPRAAVLISLLLIGLPVIGLEAAPPNSAAVPLTDPFSVGPYDPSIPILALPCADGSDCAVDVPMTGRVSPQEWIPGIHRSLSHRARQL